MNSWGKTVRYVALLVVLALSFSATNSLPVSAAPNEGITMSPVNKHYDLQPGSSFDDTFLIINQGKTDYDINVFSNGYDVEDETYSAITGNFENPLADAGTWVKFEHPTYHLKAGENITVPYKIVIPAKVTPGAHTGALYAEIQPKPTEGLRLKKSVGLVLYVNVGGEAKTEGKVDTVSIPFYQYKLPLMTSVRYLNTGNSYYTANEVVTVRDLFGTKVAEDARDFTVLPGKPRKVAISFGALSMVGIYNVQITTKVLDKEEVFSGYVLMIPFWLLISAIIAIILWIIVARHRKKERSVHFRAR